MKKHLKAHQFHINRFSLWIWFDKVHSIVSQRPHKSVSWLQNRLETRDREKYWGEGEVASVIELLLLHVAPEDKGKSFLDDTLLKSPKYGSDLVSCPKCPCYNRFCKQWRKRKNTVEAQVQVSAWSKITTFYSQPMRWRHPLLQGPFVKVYFYTHVALIPKRVPDPLELEL